MVDIGLRFIDEDLTYGTEHGLVSACLADGMAALENFGLSCGGVVT